MKKLVAVALMMALLFSLTSVVIAEDNDWEAHMKELANNPKLEGKTIGLVNAGPDDYYYKLFDVYKALAKKMGWDVTVLNSEYSPEKEISNVQDLIVKGVDAIAVITANSESAGEAAEIANKYDTPIFFIVGKPDLEEGVEIAGHVGFSYYNCGYMNGEYVAKNYPDAKVVTIDGMYGQGTAEAHAEGFQQALDDYNTGIEAESVGNGEWQRTKAMPIAEDLVASGKEFDVVYVMNEEMTAGVLQVFEEQGVTDKVILTTNAKEQGIEWIKEGKVEATAPDPPSLNAHLSFQQMVKHFKGEQYKNHLTAYGELITKENVEEAIPWKVKPYLEGVREGNFHYKLDYYEKQMEQKEN